MLLLAVLCCIGTVLSESDIDTDVYTNVALKKTTKQTSVGWGGVSDRAVDGNDATTWGGGSCTHTTASLAKEYWEVDLGKTYAVDFVEVYGRTDCCANRIQGAKLTFGGKELASLNSMGRKNNPEKIALNGYVGQKLRIEVSKQYLTLCEVKVWVKKTSLEEEFPTVYVDRSFYVDDKKYIDVAYEQNTSQSTSAWGGVASRAVDGDIENQNWNKAGCTHTNGDKSWWQVDLPRVYPIAEVRVYGRTDGHTDRLDGTKVYFGRSLCGTLTDNKGKAGAYDSITCEDSDHGNAKRVRIEMSDRYLTLCTVQVLVKTEDVKSANEAEEELPTPVYYGELVDGMYNVAQGKPATQSTAAHSGGVASRAVDGGSVTKTNLQWWKGSCTHTNSNSGQSWWQVDLGKVYDIEEIRVYGRTDCCSDQYTGSKVYIGNNVCGTLEDKKQQAEANVIRCDEASLNRGRIVKVEQMRNYMVLCEVQVLVKKENVAVEEEMSTVMPAVGLYNVARGKNATQSSTHANGLASRGVDGWGDYSKNQFWEGSCTHTVRNGPQWFQVDLGRVYNVKHILFYGRTDCCSDQYDGAKVYLGHTLCGTLEDMKKTGKPNNITCGEDSAGRIVRIEAVNKYLTVCELKVMVDADSLEDAEPATTMPRYTNIAKSKSTAQSSTAHNGVSSRGVDGWEDETHWNSASCTHTKTEALNWWKVYLGAEYHIHSIVISGRSDCCQHRLKGAVITIDNQTVTAMTYYDKQDRWTIPLGNMKGSEVRISQLDEPMTVCEVQVIVDNEYDPSDDPAPITLTNLAEGKPATASGSFYGGNAGLANDGNTEANFYRGSCSMTGPTQGDSWWSVDLESKKKIGVVQVYPRLDDKQSHTINYATVRVGEHVCGSITYEAFQRMYSVDCGGVEGSQVSVKKMASLSLCEVKVFEFQS